MKHKIQTIAFIFFALFSIKSFSQVSFAPAVAHSIGGSWPWVVAIADLDNDGLNDVVMGTQSYGNSPYDYSLLVYKQNSLGSLNTPVQYKYPPAGVLRGIAVGDLNNDGLTDVVIGYNDSIRIYYQLPNGTLGNSISFYSGNTVDGVKVGDLNNDGLNDIVVSHWNDAFIRVFIQGAGGAFTSTTYASTQAGYDEIDIGDVNNDGLNDVVLMSGQGFGGIHVFTQNISGTLNSQVTYPLAGMNLHGMGIGDLNNDGRMDVVASGYTTNANSQLDIWYQDSTTGLLQAPVTIPAYELPEPVEVAKLGCDGKNQIIVADGGWNEMTTFSQNSANQYGPYQSFGIPYASHYAPEGIAVGDINNDGKKDVVIADYNNGLIVLINTTSCGIIHVTGTLSATNASCNNKSDGSVTVNLLTGTPPYTYTWNTIPVQTTQTATGLSAGSYFVTVTDANSTSVILDTTITAPAPVSVSLSINPSATSICAGTNVNFSAVYTNAGTNPVFEWQVNSTHVGLNSYTYSSSTLSNNDTVKCTITSSLTCLTGSPTVTSDVIITVGNTGIAGPVTSNRDTLCAGTTALLSASGSSGAPYQWQLSNTPNNFSNINGADSSTYTTTPLSQTTYYHLIVGSGKCADTSATHKLVVVPSPKTNFNYTSAALKVTFNPIDTAGGVISYSWNFGDGLTSNQPNPVHTYNTTGTYSVCLTVYNGSNCSYTNCENIDVELTGIVSLTPANHWNIYPNPFDDDVNISFGKDNTTIKRIELYDLTGRRIYDKLFDQELSGTLKINLPGLAQGAYYLRIQTEETSYLQPLIKQ